MDPQTRETADHIPCQVAVRPRAPIHRQLYHWRRDPACGLDGQNDIDEADLRGAARKAASMGDHVQRADTHGHPKGTSAIRCPMRTWRQNSDAWPEQC
jgi:hypothetical protein